MPDVYFFGSGKADGNAGMKAILGGKGANLAEMTSIGIPVPPGFTISAQLCGRYLSERKLPRSLNDDVEHAMARLQDLTGRRFGDSVNPLLVSVRSGAAVSMPGMMDTILNLGLNQRTVEALAKQSGNPRFAYDSFRRFIQMYGNVVFGVGAPAGEVDPFEHVLETVKRRRKVKREIVERGSSRPFPDNPWDQLWGAVEAVFRSWQTRRAADYRRVHRIPDDMG